MADEKNYEDYTAREMAKILSEVRKNPENHGYKLELIERFEKIEKEWGAELPKSPLMKVSESVDRASKALMGQNPFLEIYENSPHAKWARNVERINSIFLASERFEKALGESSIIKHFKQMDEFAKNVQIAMGAFYDSLKQLSKRGWYISPRPFDKMPFSKTPYFVKVENYPKFEVMIVEEIEKVMPELIEDCQKSFPNRSDVFDEIQKLYDAGFYRAVIALCYTQADGISNDIFGVGFFDKDRKNQYMLRSYLELKKKEFNHSIGIISQLEIPTNEITAYSQSEDLQQEAKMKSSFNRHLVLHGHSIDYGTKLNAIRAICILDFLQYLTQAVELNENLDKVDN